MSKDDEIKTLIRETLDAALKAVISELVDRLYETNRTVEANHTWATENAMRFQRWTKQASDIQQSQDDQLLTLRKRVDRLEEREAKL